MPLTVVGTVPYEGFPLTHEECNLENGKLKLGQRECPCGQGDTRTDRRRMSGIRISWLGKTQGNPGRRHRSG